MEQFNQWFLRLYAGVGPRPNDRGSDERGDVPGWVMIVVMTATIVAGLTLIAGPQLQRMLIDALNAVGG